ncbi:hypothetical protein EYC58_01140 [Candidatus Saccharibacteria bacterium]|nr:MAG: hypothetical protein EYC58_01140 [Candidatus Saccharibacteria bacterium]
MDPNEPQGNPPEDDELETLNEPDDTTLQEPPTDGEPLADDSEATEEVDEIQEPLDDEEDVEIEVDEDDSADEANAFEDEDKPSPLP